MNAMIDTLKTAKAFEVADFPASQAEILATTIAGAVGAPRGGCVAGYPGSGRCWW